MQNKSAILSTAYLPPVSYFALMAAYPSVTIDIHEHFIKQTFRNRCRILTANGVIPLVIPVVHGRKEHTPVKDIRISYDANWQKIHWKSIESGYRSSSYFEFYEDDLKPFYLRKTEFLVDFNDGLLQVLLKRTGLDTEIKKSAAYEKTFAETDDYRGLSPKKQTDFLSLPEYTQVFADRFSFYPDLSIIDLLFNAGPASLEIIRRSADSISS